MHNHSNALTCDTQHCPRWLRAFLLSMLQSLGFRLQLVALAPVRNYKEGRELCAASVVRNVATLLQLLAGCYQSNPNPYTIFVSICVASNSYFSWCQSCTHVYLVLSTWMRSLICLRQGCAMGDMALAHAAELLLRCAASLRRVEGDTLHCWVTRQDLAQHLEDCSDCEPFWERIHLFKELCRFAPPPLGGGAKRQSFFVRSF